MSAPQTFPNAQAVSPLDGVKPHQPLTRGQCDLLAVGHHWGSKEISDALFRMFGDRPVDPRVAHYGNLL